VRDGRDNHIKDVNARYHDVAAGEYDVKWGINYEETGRSQVVGKLRKALAQEAPSFVRSLEIGAGTGYFSLNLLRAGVIERAVATDISQGMLDELSASAERLGLSVETACCEADSLPFDDESFDLVLGHAVLHHLPDLESAFAEFRRVLRPGGTVVFCGEPSRYGNRLAEGPKRVAIAMAPLWRRAMRVAKREGVGDERSAVEHALEFSVDVHAFVPADLERPLRRAGFDSVRVSGEELASSWFGWLNRTLESTAEPLKLPRSWYQYAYRGYLILQQLDRAVLEPRLPATLFYNLLLSARAPAGASTNADRPLAVAQPAAVAAR
jgi:ubiquinone/menaquinone biosynthesis C-methylase UbiE